MNSADVTPLWCGKPVTQHGLPEMHPFGAWGKCAVSRPWGLAPGLPHCLPLHLRLPSWGPQAVTAG